MTKKNSSTDPLDPRHHSQPFFRLPLSVLGSVDALPFAAYTQTLNGLERRKSPGESISPSELSDAETRPWYALDTDRLSFARVLLTNLAKLDVNDPEILTKRMELYISSGDALAKKLHMSPHITEAFYLANEWIERLAADISRNELRPIAKLQRQTEAAQEHAVRTAMTSGFLGHTLGYAQQSIVDLIHVGFVHDLGSALTEPTEQLPDTHELEHPRLSVELVTAHGKLRDSVYQGILKHHERIDGSGFPYGLRGHDIPWSARVVGLVDFIDERRIHITDQRAKNIRQKARSFRTRKGFDTDISSALRDLWSKNKE